MSIGEIIKTKREELGMTQQEIAEKLFVSRQTVSRWESGSRCPDLITAKKIANVLGITVDDLVPSEDLANYTPVKDKPPVLNKMLAALFLLGLSIWLLVFSAASNETFFAVLSIVLLFGSAFLFIAGYFYDPAPQTDSTNDHK